MRDIAEAAIESAGEPFSSASDLLNMRTRYTRRPRKQRPRKLFFRKPSSTLIGLRICMTSQSLTRPDFDSARAQYDASEGATEVRSCSYERGGSRSARHLSDCALSYGDIVKKAVELGAFVGPGVPAFALAKTDSVKIVVGVPDTAVRSIKVGQPVEVAIDAFPARTFHARINRMSSAADTVTRNFEVEVAIPNRDHLLKVGMIGSLQFANADGASQTSALLVPTFRRRASEGWQVWRVRCFKLGFRRTSSPPQRGDRLCKREPDITVLTGLKTPGDRIITTGANLLKDGQPVEVLQ